LDKRRDMEGETWRERHGERDIEAATPRESHDNQKQ